MDLSKNVYDEESHFFSEKKEGYKVSCVKILMFCYITRKLLFIWNIAHLSTLKTSKTVVKVYVSKSICDGEHKVFLKWRGSVKCLV